MDTYLKAKNVKELNALRDFLINVMEPQKGRAAQVNEDESVAAAVGDTAYWYTCVRAPFALTPFDGIEACATDEGRAVCGVWA